MLLKSQLPIIGASKSAHAKTWLKELQADAEQILDGKEGESWIMNPTKTSMLRIIELKVALKIEMLCVDSQCHRFLVNEIGMKRHRQINHYKLKDDQPAGKFLCLVDG